MLLLSPRHTPTGSISSPHPAKLSKILFPLYERLLGLSRPPAPRVHCCLFLGQERLFVPGGIVARGLPPAPPSGGLVRPVKVFFFTSSRKKRGAGGVSIKAGSLQVLTAVGQDDLADFMCTSCFLKGGGGGGEHVRGLSTETVK